MAQLLSRWPTGRVLVPGNTTAYPRQLVSLVQARLHEAKAPAPKVFGIGTSRDFQANWN
jgi:hypothetical protein